MSKKLGGSGKGLGEKGKGVTKGTADSPPPPTPYFSHSLAVFVPFANVTKRKGNGCHGALKCQ